MPKNRNLLVALSKCEHCWERRWGACVTPSEALELVAAGAKAAHADAVVRFKKSKEKGDCRSWWFYFTPDANLEKLLHERYH